MNEQHVTPGYEPRGYCPKCNYPLEVGTCPECGSVVAANALLSSPRPWYRKHENKIRIACFTILGVLALPFAVCAVYLPMPNFGQPFGYYGRLNRVMARLEKIPNLDIYSTRCNPDLTLEDFFLDMWVGGKYTTTFEWHDYAPTTHLLDRADRLILTSTDYGVRIFDLGESRPLENAVGHKIRSGTDVLANLVDIMEIIETTPTDALKEMSSDGPSTRWDFRVTVHASTTRPPYRNANCGRAAQRP